MFYGHTFHVVGILQRTGMGIDNSVFVRFEDAYTMADESELKAVKKLTIPREKVSAVLVKVEPGYSPAEVAQEIQEQVPGTKTITPNGLLNAVSGQLGAVTRILFGSTLAVTIVAIPLLGFISAMVAHERMKEISILRALGAKKAFVMQHHARRVVFSCDYWRAYRDWSGNGHSRIFPGFYCIYPEGPLFNAIAAFDDG